jgi:hypothetical protein
MDVIISDTSLRHNKTYGSQHIVVECKAHLSNLVTNHGTYSIEYYRDPISGDLRSVVCKPVPEEETSENTLTVEAVKEYVWDHLQR